MFGFDFLDDMVGFRTTSMETIGRQLAENPGSTLEEICEDNGIDPDSLSEEEQRIIFDSYCAFK